MARSKSLDEFLDVADEKSAEDAGISDICERYAKAKEVHDELNAKLKMAKETMESLRDVILKKMDESRCKSFTTQGSALRFTAVEKTFYRLPAKSEPETRSKLWTWMRRVGLGDLIELTVHHATFNKVLNERVLEMKKTVPDYIQKYKERQLSVTKAGEPSKNGDE